MADNFSILNEPRRPWLDADALKEKFLALSAEVHPDRVHRLGESERAAAQERYTELNAAYNCLREPKERLRHLLELEVGELPKNIQQIPPELMDLSLEIGQACRQADALLAEKAGAVSPLLKVQFFERGQAEAEELQALQRKTGRLRDQLEQQLKNLDAKWGATSAPDRAELLGQLEKLYRLFSYYTRWIEQLQTRVVSLSV